MFSNSISRKLKLLLLGSVGLGALAAVAAQAQEAAQTETVTVTGTRIPRADIDLPNPTTTVGAVDIANSGNLNLTDYLKRIPALTGSLGDYQTTGYASPASSDGSSLAGLNLLDLRNLGYIRTLVLIDGKRSVAESTGSAAVDTETIPLTLIDRVEVSTGGASAIYGADAVSGAVNFIMKHDLEGLTARAQAGTSQDGGAARYLLAASYGQGFDGGRGNVTLTVEGAHEDHLAYTSRSFENVGGRYFFVSNPYASSPQFIPTNDVAYITSAPTGAITSNPFNALPDFLGNGQPFNPGTDVGNASAIGSSGMPYANDLAGDFQPKKDRLIAQVSAHYDFSDRFKLSGEFKYAHVRTVGIGTAPFDDITFITGDNAFLPSNVRAAINANGTGDPASPNYLGMPYNVGILAEDYLRLRDFEENRRDTFRSVIGAEGDLGGADGLGLSNLKYTLSYVYGQTDTDDIQHNNRISDRFFAALDSVIDPATGQPTCRSNLDPTAIPPDLTAFGAPIFSDTSNLGSLNYPESFTPGPNSGCVAFNPFDPNAAQTAAVAWVSGDSHVRGVITQQVLTGYLTGDLDFPQSLGTDGPLSVVLGGEYRRETSATTPDALAASDNAWASGTSAVRGAFNVGEGFIELALPILKNRDYAQELSIDVAGRVSSYSTAGESESWKVGGIWQPFSWLRVRGTEAYAVRAPNVGELYSPVQQLFSSVDDPCDKLFVGQGTQYRQANCVAIENALGVPYTPGTTNLQTGAQVATSVGGNVNLQPESARTVTGGFVLTPLPGLTMSADWYNVSITNAIQALSAQLIADECVDLSSINNPYCAAVVRSSPLIAGALSQISAQQINTAALTTAGLDVTLNYAMQTADLLDDDYGSLNFHVIGNYLDKLAFDSLAGEAPTEDSGEAGGGFDGNVAPKWQANIDITWAYEKWSVDYNIDIAAGLLRTDRQTLWSQPDTYAPQFIRLENKLSQSVQIGYLLENGLQVYGGVNNLFYQKPAFGTAGTPVDPVGRFFYAGVNLSTDNPGGLF